MGLPVRRAGITNGSRLCRTAYNRRCGGCNLKALRTVELQPWILFYLAEQEVAGHCHCPAGTAACRSILTVLEAKPGQPLAAAPPLVPPTSSASPISSLLSQPGFLAKLAAMSRDELITLFKQINAIPVRPLTPRTAGPRFHLIEIPQLRKPDGGR